MKNLCFASCIVFILNTNQAFGAKGGMPQLNTEFWASQIFWLILIFSILYIIIWKIFLPKITDIIENRKSRIIGDLNETQKLKENAEKKLREYNKIIEDTKKEAKRIIELTSFIFFSNEEDRLQGGDLGKIVSWRGMKPL